MSDEMAVDLPYEDGGGEAPAAPAEQPKPVKAEKKPAKSKSAKAKSGSGKKSKGKSGKGKGGVSVASHPRARAQVRRAKGWGGLGGFAVAAYLSYQAGVPPEQIGIRALAAGAAGYVVAWATAVTIWRHLVLAELRAHYEQRKAHVPPGIPLTGDASPGVPLAVNAPSGISPTSGGGPKGDKPAA